MTLLSSLVSALREGTLTSRQAVENAIARVNASQSHLNAFVHVCAEEALTAADHADRRRASGESGPLLGVPIAVKDNIVTKDVVTRAGSKILGDFIPPYDADVVQRLKAAGAVIVGKTNLDEFGMGSTNEYSAFGPVAHPTLPHAVPGGSSGGSAAALAADLVPLALGTDTGGSIRQPASLTGVVGLKPTYGRVSRYGLISYASSMDQIGPMATSVQDAATLLSVIAGHDPRDATSSTEAKGPWLEAATRPCIKGKRVGVVDDYFAAGLDDDVRQATAKTLDRMKAEGAELVSVSMPHLKHAVATYYVLATAEASSNLARFDGLRFGRRAADVTTLDELYERSRSEGFGPEVKKRILLGTYVLSAGYYDAYYVRAQKVRTLIRQDFDTALSEVDLLITPVTPTSQIKQGASRKDPLSMYLGDILTVSANLAGVPALSVPCGHGDEGAPVGIQLMGRWFDEHILFSSGAAIEMFGGAQ